MSARSIRVWDLPVRLTHWALVLCIASAFVLVALARSIV